MVVTRESFVEFIQSLSVNGSRREEIERLHHPMGGYMQDGDLWAWKLSLMCLKYLELPEPRVEVGRKETIVMFKGLPRVTIAHYSHLFVGGEATPHANEFAMHVEN